MAYSPLLYMLPAPIIAILGSGTLFLLQCRFSKNSSSFDCTLVSQLEGGNILKPELLV